MEQTTVLPAPDAGQQLKAPPVEVFSDLKKVSFAASTAKDDGTVDCVWYGGATVPRMDPSTGEPYMLRLAMEGCRMERLNAGAPIFDSHMTGGDLSSWAAGTMGTRAQMGVVQKAWADGQKGMASLKFDMGNPAAAELHRKVSMGIIQNLSFGTWIYEREKTQVNTPLGEQQDADQMEVYTATDWEPFEISPVPVPADFGTQFLSAQPPVANAQQLTLANLDARAVGGFIAQNADKVAAAFTKLSDSIEKSLLTQTGTSVPVGAEEQAIERANSPKGAIPVEQTTTQDAGSARDNKVALDAVRAETIALERQRVSEIRSMGQTHKMESLAASLIDRGATTDEARARFTTVSEITLRSQPFKQQLGEAWIGKFIENGGTVEQFGAAALEQLAAKGQQAVGGKPHPVQGEVTITRESRDTVREQMEAALLVRYDPSKFRDLRDKGHDFAGLTLWEMARESLNSCGVNTRGMDRNALAKAALFGRNGASEYFTGAETTSDFPSILANVANKTLRMAYEAYPQTFKAFCRQVTATDFKPINRTQLSDAPTLRKLGEKGEYHRANLTDSNQTYSLATFGEIVAITRKVIINDDLQAFTRIPALLGVAAAQMESDTVWAALTSNPTMGEDGVALFHATHANLLTGANSALTLGAAVPPVGFAAARVQMRQQKGPKGTILNLIPRFALVPTTLETTLLQLVSPLNIASSDATKVVPEWVRSIVPVVEPRLDAASTAAWYTVADPAQIDTLEYCYLEGQQGVYIETRNGFEVDGVEIKARLDFAASAIDFRGLQKNNGA